MKQIGIRSCKGLVESSVKASVTFTVHVDRLVYYYPSSKSFNPKTMANIVHDESVNHITADSHDDVTEPKIPSVDKTSTTVFDKEECNRTSKIKTVFDEVIFNVGETSSSENLLWESNH